MEYIEISAKNVSEAITNACEKLVVSSDNLDYVVVEEGSSGFLGIGSKPAIIKARIKEEESIDISNLEIKEKAPVEKKNSSNNSLIEEKAKVFLDEVFKAMDLEVKMDINYKEEDNSMDINLEGTEMGILIGKRGQTLDSLQYLISLVVNRETEDYVRVKLDTEDYRKRRKETLENLARNMAFKVKRNKRPLSLEPMNPYERRIIHSALQNDKYVSTHSEGEAPFRRVVVTFKKQ